MPNLKLFLAFYRKKIAYGVVVRECKLISDKKSFNLQGCSASSAHCIIRPVPVKFIESIRYQFTTLSKGWLSYQKLLGFCVEEPFVTHNVANRQHIFWVTLCVVVMWSFWFLCSWSSTLYVDSCSILRIKFHITIYHRPCKRAVATREECKKAVTARSDHSPPSNLLVVKSLRTKWILRPFLSLFHRGLLCTDLTYAL